MSADSPRRSSGNASRGLVAVPAIVPPQVVSDRSILDSAIGFINEVTLAHQPHTDPKDTITWARFETAADISDPKFGEDWELEGNVAPPLLLILGYGLGVQVWAIPANGEAVEVLSWRHGIVSALRVLPTPSSSVAVEENGRADEPNDVFAEKRPLIALVDGSSSSGAQPQFCAVNFISLKTGTQVKAIKFKNPVIDVLANRSSIVITFHERIAVFDARTLEDRLSITTCYPSPGINPNPIALGHRWLAYAEHKLLHSKRSGGGCDGEGVASYTATVLNASKSLVKGLRELGEQVAAGLTGTSGSATSSKNTSFDSGTGPDSKQSGIVTIVDIKNPLRDYSPTSGVPMSSAQTAGTDPIVAHFIAHSEALVAMEFDNSGMLLVTADRRGHDFHVFRIQPNPVGPSLAAVHHLYVLHRGDTSAKVQNISFSLDSRWVAVSTLRGTTHVFPITPYGGPMGVRTHTSLHVVNKLSRFHRSAGLSAEGRSNSPISHSESTTFSLSLQPYHNTTLPPYPRPTVVMPLAQLRQPFALGSPPGSATMAGGKSGPGGQGSGSQRQRLSSLSDDSGKPLSVCAIFAKSRSWLLDPPNVTREAPHRMQRKAVDSLFVMAGHGALIQYDLDTKLASNVAKEKICDDTPIELEVEAKAQWNLGRRKEGSQEIMPPLSMDNWLVKNRNSCMLTDSTRQYDDSDDRGESWLAQVEIVTHAGPHRRLWMGPQFVFKTYNTPSGSNLSHVDIEAVEIGTNNKATTSTTKPEHSSPLNMPLTAAGRSSAVPVLIESGSYSSIEQSPKLMDRFRHDHLDSDYAVAHGDTRLKEDLADAMRESPSVSAASKESGGRGCETGCSSDNIAFYDALAEHDDQDQDPDFLHERNASAAALASALPNIHSYDTSSSYESIDSLKKPKASIEKIVNPLGTVTTVTSCLTADVQTDILDEVVSQLAAEDTVIHENCDESLFRPVVTIFCDEKTRLKQEEEARINQELCQPPENISTKLVVPVIAKEVDDALNKKEKQKNISKLKNLQSKESDKISQEQSKFEELSSLNKRSKTTTTAISTAKERTMVEEKKTAKESDELKISPESKQTGDIKNIKTDNTTGLNKENEKRIVESKTTVAKESEKHQQTTKPTKGNEKGQEEIIISSATTKAKDFKESKSVDTKEHKREQALLASKERREKSIERVVAKELPKVESKIAQKMERQRNSEDREIVAKAAAKPVVKESPKQATESKAKKLLAEKRITPDKEKSPKPETSKKSAANAFPADELKDEKPIEFMRMTPAAEEKASSQKTLSKKELKKQQQLLQQQKNKEEEAQANDKEQSKKVERVTETEKRPQQTALNNTIEIRDTAKVKQTTAAEGKLTAPLKETEKPKECAKAPQEKATILKNISTADTMTEKKLKQEQESSETLVSEVKIDKPHAAVSIKVSTIEKAAIKKDPQNTPSDKTQPELPVPAKAPVDSIIKTEQLNVKDLADSLIELKDDAEENTSNEEESIKRKLETTPLLETVDIFAAPTKSSKKNKKKANKSGTSSETEEIVEISKPSAVTKTKAKEEEESPVLKKKSSLSSEDSYTDLADSLLEKKENDLEKTMFISFAQIEQRKKSEEERIMPKKQTDDGEKLLKMGDTKDSESKQDQKNPKSKEKEENKKQSVKKQQEFDKSKVDEKLKDNEPKAKSEEKICKVKPKRIEEKVVENLEKDSNKENDSVELEKTTEYKVTVKEEQVIKKEKLVSRKEKSVEQCKESKSKENIEVKVEESTDLSIKGKKETLKATAENETDLEQTAEEKFSNDKKSTEKESAKDKNEMAKKIGQKLKDTEKVKKSSEIEEEVKPLASKKTTEKVDDSKESDKEKLLSTKVSTKSDETKKKNPSLTVDDKIKISETKAKDEIKTKVAEDKKEDKKTSPDSKESLKKTNKEQLSPADHKKSELINKSVDNEKAAIKPKEIKGTFKEKAAEETAKVEIESHDDKQKPQAETFSKTTFKGEVIVEQPKLKKKEELHPGNLSDEEDKIATPSKQDVTAEKKKQPLESSKELLKNKNTPPTSPKKNDGNINKPETSKVESSTTNKAAEKTTQKEVIRKNSEKLIISTENVKKSTSNSDKNIEDSPIKGTNKKDEEPKIKYTETSLNESNESDKTAPKASTASPKKSLEKAPLTAPATLPPPPPITCAWKTLSGADMIAKNLNKQDVKTDSTIFPSLGAISKTPKTSKSDKLLPELPTPKDLKEPLGMTKPASKKPINSSAMDDFPILKPLDALPPLPTLEPLELISDSKAVNIKDISLINFESPLQENPALERKITPPPRGFTEQNLIFALCGSLHYENEQRSRVTPEKTDISPTTPSSSNRSSSALDEPSMADYKSLTENDDPYISLEQSSQDTNTTNTNTTNDKFSSSTNSSGTEEVIILEEKKMTKKQKRKRQQQLLELQKQKEQQLQQQHHHTPELDDDELRPLIAMSESQIETIADNAGGLPSTMPSLLDESFSMKPLITKSNTLTHSTTTDSEGPMPATTSDDNVFVMPTASSQHKIKTKKLEHKINLIAAIEAATSSSTSSAEESGVELGGGRSHDPDDHPCFSPAALISSAASTSVLPMSMAAVVAAGAAPVPLGCTVGALKKKTKRRYQFHKAQGGNDNVDGMDKIRNKLNNKKSTIEISNSNHDSNTTTITAMKKKLAEKKSLQMSQEPTLPPQQQQQTTDTHNSIYEMKQQQNNTASLQYLTHNAVDNCFGHMDGTSMTTSDTAPPTARLAETVAEAATIVNIDIFDDQLSTSSISNTSRFSCEAAPLTTTTPPISLNGVIDTNLMYFSQNTTAAGRATSGGGNKLSKGDAATSAANASSSSSALHNDNQRANYRRGGGRRGVAYADDDDDDVDGDDDDNSSSNGSAGSL